MRLQVFRFVVETAYHSCYRQIKPNHLNIVRSGIKLRTSHQIINTIACSFVSSPVYLEMARKRTSAKTSQKAKKEEVKKDDPVKEDEEEVEEPSPTKKTGNKKASTQAKNKKAPKETKKTASQKRKKVEDDDDSEDADEPKPKLKATVSVSDSLSGIDFTSTKGKGCGKTPNFKIASWNINGIRAWIDKDGTSYLKSEKPDVLCVQELKCAKDKIPKETEVEGYTCHWLSGDKEGYSGVGIYYKQKPIKITDGIGISKHDNEGRCITAEFEQFYLVNTYIPNSSRGLVRLDYRTKEWDVDFREYLKKLDAVKPVVWCGDLNVSHQEIDIKNVKGNKKNAGFTSDERESFSATLEAGFFDSFRHLNPELEGAYTYWSYFMNSRSKNVGWRLDYFVMSEKLKENLCDSLIRSTVMGSDHCPIVLEMAL